MACSCLTGFPGGLGLGLWSRLSPTLSVSNSDMGSTSSALCTLSVTRRKHNIPSNTQEPTQRAIQYTVLPAIPNPSTPRQTHTDAVAALNSARSMQNQVNTRIVLRARMLSRTRDHLEGRPTKRMPCILGVLFCLLLKKNIYKKNPGYHARPRRASATAPLRTGEDTDITLLKAQHCKERPCHCSQSVLLGASIDMIYIEKKK